MKWVLFIDVTREKRIEWNILKEMKTVVILGILHLVDQVDNTKISVRNLVYNMVRD